jgi:hypothetical protein
MNGDGVIQIVVEGKPRTTISHPINQLTIAPGIKEAMKKKKKKKFIHSPYGQNTIRKKCDKKRKHPKRKPSRSPPKTQSRKCH